MKIHFGINIEYDNFLNKTINERLSIKYIFAITYYLFFSK